MDRSREWKEHLKRQSFRGSRGMFWYLKEFK